MIPVRAASDHQAAAPVLVFGDDTSAFLGAVRSLGRKGLAVHGAGSGFETPAHASRYLTTQHTVPVYRGDGAEWLARVQSLIREHGFALLVPTSDASLLQLAAHRQALLPARCAIPSDEALALFTDKWATREAASSLGVPVAEGMLIPADCSADEIIDRLGLPLILKSRQSYSRGSMVQKSAVARIEHAQELEVRSASLPGMLAEGFVPGFCRGVSVLAHEGQVLQAFQHRRLQQEHATGPSSSRVSEPLDTRLLDAVQKLIAHAGYTGIAMFEFRYQEGSDAFVLLEVNPRIWGSIQLAMHAEADFVAALHGLLVEDRLPPRRMAFPAGRQKMSMEGEWDRHVFEWQAAAGITAQFVCLLRFATYCGSLVNGAGFDSFASDDPEPFRRERAVILSRLRDKFRKRHPQVLSGAHV